MKSMNKDMVEEAREEEKEASTSGEEHAKGGKVAKRKRGGKVPGKMAMGRPDRRARGGATSDKSPYTAAGNVSSPSYESKGSISNGGGAGPDKSPYSGGHRRPG